MQAHGRAAAPAPAHRTHPSAVCTSRGRDLTRGLLRSCCFERAPPPAKRGWAHQEREAYFPAGPELSCPEQRAGPGRSGHRSLASLQPQQQREEPETGESPKPTTAARQRGQGPTHDTHPLCTLATENRSSDSLAPF